MSFHRGLNKAGLADVLESIQPGDVLAFGGIDLRSKAAGFFTRSNVTHVAAAVQRRVACDAPKYELEIIEWVFNKNGYSGVRTVNAQNLIAGFQGKVWWLPLGTRQRNKVRENLDKYNDWMLHQVGRPFDFKKEAEAVLTKFDDTPLADCLFKDEADLGRLFSAELIATGLDLCGAILTANAAEVTPIDLCTFNIFADYYVLIHDTDPSVSERINGFNTVNETSWGM